MIDLLKYAKLILLSVWINGIFSYRVNVTYLKVDYRSIHFKTK